VSANEPTGRVHPLFVTPLLLDELDGAPELNAILAERILAKRSETAGLNLSNRGGWQSSHDFTVWSGDAGRAVIARAVELATAHSQRSDGAPPRWTIEAWANVSGPGAFNMPHVHGGTYWSAVYYVRVGGGEGGQLVLHDPRMPGLRMHAPDMRFRNMGPELRAEVKPKEGLLALFPGWLSHSVEPWEGTGERISVAMNIRAAA
jgi:uncharacterized protein (TIGR02466 family)